MRGKKGNDAFWSLDELRSFGFASFGEDVQISKHALIYQPHLISIGNNVRIDDFAKLNGKITIGSNIHIASFVCLMGSYGITLKDYAQVSLRATLLSATDDFSGEFLVGPQIPSQYRKISGGEIVLEKHALVGAGSMIFPGVTLREGTAVGAMSLVMRSTKKWTVYFGNPAVAVKERSRNMLELEKLMNAEANG
ncbi:acyltransferase [Aminivibrio sp.]|uniref:acyltransferase n=1 Tax=Aminivibrio sp. TaxID=1872489 RepID=UPI001A500C2B|nr:acyltransferase [Aminivibrio sp.]MBL3539452.1 acyltransferase [Aminivibrio sp.]